VTGSVSNQKQKIGRALKFTCPSINFFGFCENLFLCPWMFKIAIEKTKKKLSALSSTHFIPHFNKGKYQNIKKAVIFL